MSHGVPRLPGVTSFGLRPACHILLLSVVIGCGAKTDDATASAGQHDIDGDAGTGGTQNVGTESSACVLPTCLSKLFAACGGSTTCSAEPFDAEWSFSATMITSERPDGTTCYAVEARSYHYGETGEYTWSDGAGRTIATASRSTGIGDHFDISCSDGSETIAASAGTGCGPFDLLSLVVPTCPSQTTQDASARDPG
jgi:hypothetical protein